MDDATKSLFEELVRLLQESRWEIAALRHIMVESQLVSEQELVDRIADVKREELEDISAELKRRAFEKTLKSRPTQ